MHEKMDNPLVFLLLIAVGVYAIGGVGRYFGRRVGSQGVTSFFGG